MSAQALNPSALNPSSGRVGWVDAAKGICIFLVVMMHSTLGVEAAAGQTGWMSFATDFAKPFRMPDFFLLAALFLASRINAPWRLYLDRKVLHFVYFYLLWLVIQCLFKCVLIYGHGAQETLSHLAWSLIEPFGILWFIYLLAVFFVVTRLVRDLPVWLVWSAAALLKAASITTGWSVIDQFAAHYVYFYTGYALARPILAFADAAASRPLIGLAGLALWGLANGYAVHTGVADLPGMGLVLGFAGAIAVTVTAALIAETIVGRAFAYAGARTLAIYLAFFLPMAALRIVLLKTGIITDVGTISALVTVFAYTTPLIALVIAQRIGLSFLFVRPSWARIDTAQDKAANRLAPAE